MWRWCLSGQHVPEAVAIIMFGILKLNGRKFYPSSCSGGAVFGKCWVNVTSGFYFFKVLLTRMVVVVRPDGEVARGLLCGVLLRGVCRPHWSWESLKLPKGGTASEKR